jgi:hypothetical protein
MEQIQIGGGHILGFDQKFHTLGLIAMFLREHSKIRNLIKAKIYKMEKITLIRAHSKRKSIKN